MRNDPGNDIGIAGDFEIEAPTAVDPRLLPVFRLAVFLSVERRVVEIGDQESRLLVEGLAYGKGISGSASRGLF
jgi:hypothetical protein